MKKENSSLRNPYSLTEDHEKPIDKKEFDDFHYDIGVFSSICESFRSEEGSKEIKPLIGKLVIRYLPDEAFFKDGEVPIFGKPKNSALSTEKLSLKK